MTAAPARGPLLIVGGYGLLGSQAARILRRRNPGLELILAGRRPAAGRALAGELGRATVAAVDVGESRPLASLPERPAAVVAAVTDPDANLLEDALREGVPFADMNRAGGDDVLDALVRVARHRPPPPVLLAGAWMGGVSAMLAAAAAEQVGTADRIDLTILASTVDRVGENSTGFAERWAVPFAGTSGGRRHSVQPLTGLRRVRCCDRRRRVSLRVGTLEQLTLPVVLGVPDVEARMALDSSAATVGLAALKRSGAIRLLSRPRLAGARHALLHRSGPGGVAGLTVRALGRGGDAAVDLFDPHGQAHSSAAGAADAAERLLGIRGAQAIGPGLHLPEQLPDPGRVVDVLRGAGARITLHGFAAAPAGARLNGSGGAAYAPALATALDGRTDR